MGQLFGAWPVRIFVLLRLGTYKIAVIQSLFTVSLVFHRRSAALSRSTNASTSYIIRSVFSEAEQLVYTCTSYNSFAGYRVCKTYSLTDAAKAEFIVGYVSWLSINIPFNLFVGDFFL